MSNSVLLSQAAGQRCAWTLSANAVSATAQGTSLPVGVWVAATAGGVFAAAQPRPDDRTQVTVQQITGEKYHKNMARITAAGGDKSGSHPAWDPV